MRIFWPRFSLPSLTRTRITTPRYWSYPAIDQQCLQGRRAVPAGSRQPSDQRLQHAFDVETGLGADLDRVGGVEPDHVLDLLLHPLGLGGGKVDLVEHGHDLVAGVERLIDVGERLRLHPLARVDHQQAALAGGEAAAHLVGEVDMARRVHQVQLIDLPIMRLVREADGLRLDGDAPLALQLHVVENLVGHLAIRQRAAGLDQPVGESGLAVVDMGDDREIADMVDRGVGHGTRSRATPGGIAGVAARALIERNAPYVSLGSQRWAAECGMIP